MNSCIDEKYCCLRTPEFLSVRETKNIGCHGKGRVPEQTHFQRPKICKPRVSCFHGKGEFSWTGHQSRQSTPLWYTWYATTEMKPNCTLHNSKRYKKRFLFFIEFLVLWNVAWSYPTGNTKSIGFLLSLFSCYNSEELSSALKHLINIKTLINKSGFSVHIATRQCWPCNTWHT